MRRVGVKRSNPDSPSNYEENLSTVNLLQPRSKKRRVGARSDGGGVVNRVVNWCWTTFNSFFSTFSSSQNNDVMPHKDSHPLLPGVNDAVLHKDNDVMPRTDNHPLPGMDNRPLPRIDNDAMPHRGDDFASGEGCEDSHFSNGNNSSRSLSVDAVNQVVQSASTASAHSILFSPLRVPDSQISLLESREPDPFRNQQKTSPSAAQKTKSLYKCSIQTSTPLPKSMQGTQSARLIHQRESQSSVKYIRPSTVRHSQPSSVKQLHSFSKNQFPSYPTNYPTRKGYPSVKPTSSIDIIPLHSDITPESHPELANRFPAPPLVVNISCHSNLEEIGPASQHGSLPSRTQPKRELKSFSSSDRITRSHSMNQTSEIHKISQWIQDLKSRVTGSSQDRQVLVDIAKRKLSLQRAERHTLEDARVVRLRTLLDDVSLSKSLVPRVSLSLTAEQDAKVTMAMQSAAESECLSEKYNILVTCGDLCTLTGLRWLNDNVVNFYFNLIRDRYKGVHVMSSFFYPKLSQSGYSSVRRWTKKVDLFAMDLVLLPIHLGIHWCLAVIDFNNKSLAYYDSLLGDNPTCLHRLRHYIESESMDKRKVQYNMSGWSNDVHKDIPHQENGSDCGVFMCMFARHIAAEVPFQFTQEDMPQLRTHIMCEILEQKLL